MNRDDLLTERPKRARIIDASADSFLKKPASSHEGCLWPAALHGLFQDCLQATKRPSVHQEGMSQPTAMNCIALFQIQQQVQACTCTAYEPHSMGRHKPAFAWAVLSLRIATYFRQDQQTVHTQIDNTSLASMLCSTKMVTLPPAVKGTVLAIQGNLRPQLPAR